MSSPCLLPLILFMLTNFIFIHHVENKQVTTEKLVQNQAIIIINTTYSNQKVAAIEKTKDGNLFGVSAAKGNFKIMEFVDARALNSSTTSTSSLWHPTEFQFQSSYKKQLFDDDGELIPRVTDHIQWMQVKYFDTVSEKQKTIVHGREPPITHRLISDKFQLNQTERIKKVWICEAVSKNNLIYGIKFETNLNKKFEFSSYGCKWRRQKLNVTYLHDEDQYVIKSEDYLKYDMSTISGDTSRTTRELFSLKFHWHIEHVKYILTNVKYQYPSKNLHTAKPTTVLKTILTNQQKKTEKIQQTAQQTLTHKQIWSLGDEKEFKSGVPLTVKASNPEILEFGAVQDRKEIISETINDAEAEITREMSMKYEAEVPAQSTKEVYMEMPIATIDLPFTADVTIVYGDGSTSQSKVTNGRLKDVLYGQLNVHYGDAQQSSSHPSDSSTKCLGTIIRNKGIMGYNIANMPNRQIQTPSECCILCQNTNKCLSWLFLPKCEKVDECKDAKVLKYRNDHYGCYLKTEKKTEPYVFQEAYSVSSGYI
ncbi:unnamed protein product [Didymodactylos carnosus]|uniref:Apple domain-containing protein n=1 Tax=Didymodactylos carnosus TaxID=1234261 RepID=A0A814LRT0_9BILA|nr:unnamed protein product [Didymodactylos carnosus]CAF3836130.1 unnamed protein product [Didymodactylos carnosus]